MTTQEEIDSINVKLKKYTINQPEYAQLMMRMTTIFLDQIKLDV